MRAEAWRTDVEAQFRKYKALAERALAQVSAEDWFATPDPEANSIALVVKHMAGNMRSRWTDFPATDGEKPDRRRDTEFLREPGDTPESLRRRWEEGWALLFGVLAALRDEDLERTVTVRGEPHTVMQAMHRQMTHYAYHVGQIVILAKQRAGPRWVSLSIPRGKSKEFEVAKDGTAYLPKKP
jgi:uncharacterized damage-inducible protein DinB